MSLVHLKSYSFESIANYFCFCETDCNGARHMVSFMRLAESKNFNYSSWFLRLHKMIFSSAPAHIYKRVRYFK